MTDTLSAQQRSQIMSRVRNRNTTPEVKVRSLLHQMGYRFRLHRKDLPGTPDIIFAKHRKVIFVHGCLWHGHSNCRRGKRPTTNVEFWNEKIDKNQSRDVSAQRALVEAGWSFLVIWQCEIGDTDELRAVLTRFLTSPSWHTL